MLIIPAIDIKDGKCIRLLKGEEGTETVFSHDPVDVALKWERAGASYLHIVDLDGAFNGEPRNRELIKKIVDAVDIPVQLGGGLRSIEAIESYVEAGVDRVILGTAAFENGGLLEKACEMFPGKVAVGVDTKNGKIAVKGWKEVLECDTLEVLDELKQKGVSLIIHTNVDRDGTLAGVGMESMEEFVDSCPIPLVASGGIATMADLDSLSGLVDRGLVGVILGRSIYTGSIELGEAIKRFQ